MTSISRVNSSYNEEIDLYAIMQSVWRQRRLVGAATLLMGIGAGLYAYTMTPVYEVSSMLRPAALKDLDALNRTQIYSLPPAEALARVGAALESYDTRLSYFRANPEIKSAFDGSGQTPEQAFDEFNNNALSMVRSDPKKDQDLNSFVGVQMRYPQGLRGDEILNGFINYTIGIQRHQISEDMKVIVNNRLAEVDSKLQAARSVYDQDKQSEIAGLLESDSLKRAELQDELKALRVQLKAERESRISQLTEAISIAHTLGLKKPSSPSAMSSAEQGGAMIRTEVNNQQNPLYFMGSDALEAERQVLKQRVSDDFSSPRIAQINKELQLLKDNRKVQMLRQRENEELFLKGIDALKTERARLMGITTDMSHLALVNVDRKAISPLRPVKPKKMMIIAVGLLSGLVIGVVIALFRYVILTRRLDVPQLLKETPVVLNAGQGPVEGLVVARS